MAIRKESEIQAAHDRLHAIVLGEVPAPFPEEVKPSLIAALNVLCWVLEHDHNPTFGEILTEIDAALRHYGFELRERPRAN